MATVSGGILSDGGSNVEIWDFAYADFPRPVIEDNSRTAGSGTGTFTTCLIGLAANTIYNVRAWQVQYMVSQCHLQRMSTKTHQIQQITCNTPEVEEPGVVTLPQSFIDEGGYYDVGGSAALGIYFNSIQHYYQGFYFYDAEDGDVKEISANLYSVTRVSSNKGGKTFYFYLIDFPGLKHLRAATTSESEGFDSYYTSYEDIPLQLLPPFAINDTWYNSQGTWIYAVTYDYIRTGNTFL